MTYDADTCESCFKRHGQWYVVDNNMEVTLCAKCVRELRTAGESIDRILVHS